MNPSDISKCELAILRGMKDLVVSLSNHERAAGERAVSALRQAQGGDRMETQAA